MSDEDKLIVPKFKSSTVKNEAKSKAEGRPIYDDIEVVEVRTAGDRLSIKVFPAHAFARWITNEEGDQEEQTYAQRWSAQYKKFKENGTQVAEGTPIDELPFISAAKRSELKALSIYTAEAILAIDGQPLKSLGMYGNELKAQTKAYMDKARGGADVVAMAAQITSLQQQIADLQAEKPAKQKKSEAA